MQILVFIKMPICSSLCKDKSKLEREIIKTMNEAPREEPLNKQK